MIKQIVVTHSCDLCGREVLVKSFGEIVDQPVNWHSGLTFDVCPECSSTVQGKAFIAVKEKNERRNMNK